MSYLFPSWLESPSFLRTLWKRFAFVTLRSFTWKSLRVLGLVNVFVPTWFLVLSLFILVLVWFILNFEVENRTWLNLKQLCLLLKKCKFINNFRAKFKYCQNKSEFIFIISLHNQQSSFSIFSTFRLSFFFTLDFLPAKAFIKSALSNCTRSRWFGISVTDLIVLSRSGWLSLQGT